MNLLKSFGTYDTQTAFLSLFPKNFLKVSFDQNHLKWIMRRYMKGLRSKERAE